jgi:flagellar secretion chaperone FliS
MTGNGYAKYQQNQLQTATPARLLLAAYDGALRFCGNAAEEMAKGNFDQQNYNINRAVAIICELVSALREDVDPELVARLKSLYAYVIERLGIANLQQDMKAMDDAVHVLRELRETWAEAERNIAMASARKEAA